MGDPLFDVVNGLAGRNAAADSVAIFVAGGLSFYLFVAAAVALLVQFARTHSGHRAFHVLLQGAATLALTFLASRLLRAAELIERPFQRRDVTLLVGHEPGASFPSNHATAAFAVAVVVGMFVAGRWGLALAVPAALIGIARVWVGVHWSIDIVGAAALSLGCATIVLRAVRMLRVRLPESSFWRPPELPSGGQPATITSAPAR